MHEKNPLEKWPSSRVGGKERPLKDGGDYKEIMDIELDDNNSNYHREKYNKKTRIDLEGKRLPQTHSSLEDIPDSGLLPDEFEDQESDKDEEREAYIEKYNQEHEGQYTIKQTNKKATNISQHFSVNAHNQKATNHNEFLHSEVSTIEESDLPSQEGLHIDRWPRSVDDLTQKRHESSKQISNQKALRKTKKSAMYRKIA